MSMIKEKEKNFAEGLCFKKFFLLFVLGSFVGSFYEEIVFFVQYKEWTVRHDLLYGPFSTLYGFGEIKKEVLLKPSCMQLLLEECLSI